jgi:hypothetical protein
MNTCGAWVGVLILLICEGCLVGAGQRASRESIDNQTGKGFSGQFHNDRLKLLSLPDRPITGNSHSRAVSGVWIADSKDAEKSLVFPQQVAIDCHNYKADDKGCTEIAVSLAPTGSSVAVHDISSQDYEIDRWDGEGLIASSGGDPLADCYRHVLTMDFQSGSVSVSDIPTHAKGCEAFAPVILARRTASVEWLRRSHRISRWTCSGRSRQRR